MEQVMQWLLTLETNNDMICVCRAMNLFRRKSLRITTLAMTARPTGFSLMGVVDSTEADIDYLFNFLRRTEGVQHVTCYRHESFPSASFVFIDSEEDNSGVMQALEAFPESKLIFASHGKYLLEIPAGQRQSPAAVGAREPAFLPFACVKTTRSAARPELAVLEA
jgi:acetolactate synthase regulatory subunit